MKVLVTGGGAPGIAGTIYSLRHNPLGEKITVFTSDIKGDVVGKYLSDGFFQLPPPENERYVDVLLKNLLGEEIEVILPQTTREIEVLSRHKRDFEEKGIRVVVSDHDSIQIANNKYRLMLVAKEVGIPVPEFRLVSNVDELEEAVREFGYPSVPVVVKLPFSNGMRGLRILREKPLTLDSFLNEKPRGEFLNLEDFLRIFKEDTFPEMLVMEYLPGDEYTVDVFSFPGARILEAIPRRRDQIRSGITFAGTVVRREDMIEYSKALALKLNLEFAFGFQFKEDEKGVPRLLECNPRVQGTMVMSTFAGRNFIYAGVAAVLGRDISSLFQSPIRWGLRFMRYWGGVAVGTNGEVAFVSVD